MCQIVMQFPYSYTICIINYFWLLTRQNQNKTKQNNKAKYFMSIPDMISLYSVLLTVYISLSVSI